MTFVIDSSNLGTFSPAAKKAGRTSSVANNLGSASSSLTKRLRDDAAIDTSSKTPEQAASSAAAAAEISRSDEVSVLSIAKSAIGQIQSNLTEIANLTEARESEVDPTQREELDAEITSLLSEINTIESEAEFNGQQIFDSSSSFEFEGRTYNFSSISTDALGIETPEFLYVEPGITDLSPEIDLEDGDFSPAPELGPESEPEPDVSTPPSAQEFLGQLDSAQSTLRDVEAAVDNQASGLSVALQESGRGAKADAIAEERDVFGLGGSPEETARRVSSALDQTLVAASSRSLDPYRVESLITEIERPERPERQQAAPDTARSNESNFLERARQSRTEDTNRESLLERLSASDEESNF